MGGAIWPVGAPDPPLALKCYPFLGRTLGSAVPIYPGSYPSSLLSYCVTLGELPNLSEPLCPHQTDGQETQVTQ